MNLNLNVRKVSSNENGETLGRGRAGRLGALMKAVHRLWGCATGDKNNPTALEEARL